VLQAELWPELRLVARLVVRPELRLEPLEELRPV
jgi:hypothetical protein